MKSDDFLFEVLRPNVDELENAPGDIRLAVNAIMAADAFFGLLAVELSVDDDCLRNDLAVTNIGWRIVRDMAHSLKHGELTRPNRAPRLVKSPQAMHVDDMRLRDNGVLSDDQIMFEDDDVVFITFGPKVTDRVTTVRALRIVLALIEDERNGLPRKNVGVDDVVPPDRLFG